MRRYGTLFRGMAPISVILLVLGVSIAPGIAYFIGSQWLKKFHASFPLLGREEH